jgi:hypothetical protein
MKGAYEDSFNCSRDDLIKLGQKVNPSLTGDAALALGSTQFKVSFEQLTEIYRATAWPAANILVAVAGSETDGTSGMRADATLRQEVEKFAHLIFASSVSQRDFWLGRKTASAEELRSRYGGLKPCRHGSDAHDYNTVSVPEQDRYSWVKGALEFDSLRQAVIDPAGRAFVGVEPPFRATQSQVISTVEIKGAPWATTPILALPTSTPVAPTPHAKLGLKRAMLPSRVLNCRTKREVMRIVPSNEAARFFQNAAWPLSFPVSDRLPQNCFERP